MQVFFDIMEVEAESGPDPEFVVSRWAPDNGDVLVHHRNGDVLFGFDRTHRLGDEWIRLCSPEILDDATAESWEHLRAEAAAGNLYHTHFVVAQRIEVAADGKKIFLSGKPQIWSLNDRTWIYSPDVTKTMEKILRKREPRRYNEIIRGF